MPSASVACVTDSASGRGELRLYRFALERGYLDAALIAFVVTPFVRMFRWFDALERRWTDWLSGGASRESDQVKPRFGTIRRVLMNPFQLPWLELCDRCRPVRLALSSAGSGSPSERTGWDVAFTGTSLTCSLLAWLSFYLGGSAAPSLKYSVQPLLFGRQLFALDDLSAPLVPAIALLHLLAAVATCAPTCGGSRFRGRLPPKPFGWPHSPRRSPGY